MNFIVDLPGPVLAQALAYLGADGRALRGALSVCRAAAERLRSDEELWQALSQLHFRVSDDRFQQWPRISSWAVLYDVLEQWAPREGFYHLPQTAPWGILLLLRFDGGRFAGDVLWPRKDTTGAVRFEHTEVLQIVFDETGSMEASFCGTPGVLQFNDASLILQPTDIPERQQRVPDAPHDHDNRRRPPLLNATPQLTAAWDAENDNTPVGEMLRLLWEQMRRQARTIEPSKLDLQWIDGPAQESDITYHDGMPILRPGIYAGCYHEMYGKFQNEYIFVQYRCFRFAHDGGEADERMWERIGNEIFNHADGQRDDDEIFDHVKVAVTGGRHEEVVFVCGRKLTGDVHVPMGKLTFAALVHPALATTTALPFVSDRGDHRSPPASIPAVRSFLGWGTLARFGFRMPCWDKGLLVQLALPSIQGDAFGFLWGGDDWSWRGEDDALPMPTYHGPNGEQQRLRSAAVMRWVPEQESFPWMAASA